MSDAIHTCGPCPHRKLIWLAGWCCGLVDPLPVIPQRTKGSQGRIPVRSEFRRIPTWCPRDDTEVHKSEEPSDPQHWYIEEQQP